MVQGYLFILSMIRRDGVVEFDEDKQAISIEESQVILNQIMQSPDLFFDDQVVEIAKNIQPSAREENTKSRLSIKHI